jgi:GcrA cell cycle regulator
MARGSGAIRTAAALAAHDGHDVEAQALETRRRVGGTDAFAWSDAETERLRQLMTDGLSYAQAAAELHRPRNAVIRKAHRAGWRGGQPQERAKAAEARRKRFEIIAGGFVEPDMSEHHHDGPVVGLLKLGSTACRWPIGDPKSAKFGFCGRDCEDGARYCPEHHAVAYVTPPGRARMPATAPVELPVPSPDVRKRCRGRAKHPD